MRVAVAEDGALFRDGLVQLLKAAGHEVVHSVPDGDRLAALLATDPVDVAVLDVRMPPEPEGGLVTARRLRGRQPETGLLLLSHHAEAHHLAQILRIGSERIGFRMKDRLATVDALNDTLARIAAGGIDVEPVLVRGLVDLSRRRRSDLDALSEPELAVLRLVAEGVPDDRIADRLGVPAGLVEERIASVFDTLSPGAHRPVRILSVLLHLSHPQDRTQP